MKLRNCSIDAKIDRGELTVTLGCGVASLREEYAGKPLDAILDMLEAGAEDCWHEVELYVGPGRFVGEPEEGTDD